MRQLLSIACVLVLVPGFASARQISRDDYYVQLPAMPKLVGQTDASRRLHLYGDAAGPGYVDRDPVDGIDDARAARLLRIADRFSPILRRNNFSVPRWHTSVLGAAAMLHVDTWRREQRITSDSVPIHRPVLAGDDIDLPNDSALAALVREFHPDATVSRSRRAEWEDEKVLFFDFPGDRPATWRTAYRDATDSGIYAHFFIHEDTAATVAERYLLVVQFWFFYPFNDGTNNHEGDWEHLDVALTTLDRAAASVSGFLAEDDIGRILDPTNESVLDSTIVRSVDYFFHESVMRLDYLAARSAPPIDNLRELRHLHIWEQPHFIPGTIRTRLEAAGGRLATHPIGYIGGNNKGPDVLTDIWPRFAGSYNRNGHGTYPFGGTWQGVGPVGATDQLRGGILPRLRDNIPADASRIPLRELIDDDRYVTYTGDDIMLVPDWERIKDIVLVDPAALHTWSWLILPIRWGFPVSASPGAGLIAHTDLGQIAPEGPAFQPTWNRLGAESGFHVYDPKVLRGLLVPLTPWDNLKSGWGVLNLPLALLGFVPGWAVVLTQVAPWASATLEALGAPPSKTFAPRERIHRFTSFGTGGYRQLRGDEFARLLPPPTHPGVAQVLSGALGVIDETSINREGAFAPRIWMTLHYGPRFAVQNAFALNAESVEYNVIDEDSLPIAQVRGNLEIKELTGGFRYEVRSAFDHAASLFVRGGWGWTWYTIHSVTAAGQSVAFRRDGGYAVSLFPSKLWWPNSWYGGVGVEFLSPRTVWVANRVGYGAQIEFTGLVHRLGARRPGGAALGTVTRSDIAVGLVLSW